MVAGRDPYGLDPAFESACIALACTEPTFWLRIAKELDPALLAQPAARLALEGCAAIAREGQPPENAMLVIQRLRTWSHEGRVTVAQIREVSELLDRAEDAGLPSVDAAVVELVPIVRRRIEWEMLDTGMREYAKRGDVSEVVTGLASRARLIGAEQPSVESAFGPELLDDLSQASSVERLPIGLFEVDEAMGGGLIRGTETMFLGSTGAGKSMALVHVSCSAAWRKRNVAYATLELPPLKVQARVTANRLGIPYTDLMELRFDKLRTRERMEALRVAGFGDVRAKSFTPKITTVEHLRVWVDEMEQRRGIPFDVLVVDYADKLGNGGRATDTSYRIQGDAYEALRVYGEKTNRWVVTASQTKRRENKKAPTDVEDAADSLEKSRVADNVIGLDWEEGMMRYFLAKARDCEARKVIGPIPTDFALSRIGPVDW